MKPRAEHNRTLYLDDCLSVLCQVKYRSRLFGFGLSAVGWCCWRTCGPNMCVSVCYEAQSKCISILFSHHVKGVSLSYSVPSVWDETFLNVDTHAGVCAHVASSSLKDGNPSTRPRPSTEASCLCAWALNNAGCHVGHNYLQLHHARVTMG